MLTIENLKDPKKLINSLDEQTKEIILEVYKQGIEMILNKKIDWSKVL